jgi:hypothetical protein
VSFYADVLDNLLWWCIRSPSDCLHRIACIVRLHWCPPSFLNQLLILADWCLEAQGC